MQFYDTTLSTPKLNNKPTKEGQSESKAETGKQRAEVEMTVRSPGCGPAPVHQHEMLTRLSRTPSAEGRAVGRALGVLSGP